MKHRIILAFLLIFALSGLAYGDDVETIVFIRHGEKPTDKEFGQLNCQGLNRALALADVLPKRFPNVQYIFAPGTTDKIKSHGEQFSYIRPLITIAPTAIRLKLPVNADFGYREIVPLEEELIKPKYQNSVVYVAWEHVKLDALVAQMMVDLHGTDAVPPWPEGDYDSIFVVKITTNGATRTIKLDVEKENIHPDAECSAPTTQK